VENIYLTTTNWYRGVYILNVKGSVAYQNTIITKL
jgi:hypothetical protein